MTEPINNAIFGILSFNFIDLNLKAIILMGEISNQELKTTTKISNISFENKK